MPQSAVTECRLSLLGGFGLTVGTELVELSDAGQRLLAFLAVRGRDRPVRRSTVLERLWTDSPPDQASSRLRSALCRLPRPRGQRLIASTATELQLVPDMSVDLWRMEQAADALVGGELTPPTSWGDELSALTHDLLPGWSEDWLIIEQESYRQLRMHGLERMCTVLRESGRYSTALRAGLSAVHCEPLRESAHRQVIEVHLAEGNHSEALRQFQGYRRLLADELGLAPSAAIRRLVAPYLGRPIERTEA